MSPPRSWFDHPQKFVRAWSLDSLATFAEQDGGLLLLLKRALEGFERSGSKVLQTRARHIRARLQARRESQRGRVARDQQR